MNGKKLELPSMVMTMGFFNNSRVFDRSLGDILASKSLFDRLLLPPPNNLDNKPRF